MSLKPLNLENGSLMKTPMVSVIVPNYNYARYLDERMDSVLGQTYLYFEVILLDDKSTDDSKDVLEKYRHHPRVSQIVYNENNSGSTFKQWLKGFELAKGELIWIAESDDTCEPILLEKLVSEFQKDDDLVLAFSLTRLFKDNGWIFDIPSLDKTPKTIVGGRKFIRRYMADGCYVTNASSALFRKDVALNINSQYTKFKSCGDRLFWIEIAEHGNVAIINERLNYCRRHGDNVTDKNTYDGTNQREGKMIMDYLVEKGYLNNWEKIKYSSRYVYAKIVNRDFDCKETKSELLKLWEVGIATKIYMWFLVMKAKGSKIKHMFKK